MRRGAEVGEGAVVKTRSHPAGGLFACSETSCHLKGTNKVRQQNEVTLSLLISN